MPRFIIADSGAVERTIKRLIIADSGGTSRVIKRMFVCDSGGIARQVFALATVTVSGQSIPANQPEEISVRFNSDGTVDGNFGANGGGYQQIDGATDWVIPHDAAPDDYQIRAVLNSGSIDAGSSDALNTWLALTTTREWFVDDVGTTQLTISIRKGSGSVIDSGVYTLNIPPP